MSISCPMEDSRSSLVLVPVRRERLKKMTSQRRIEANRRNAQRSTGPKTAVGKARVARNAVKHELCAARVCLPEECKATFNLHAAEIEEELEPRTIFQRILCTQIINLSWQMHKLPEAQAKLFGMERRKAMAEGEDPGTDEEPAIPPCEVLARRFSDEPTRNGFLLFERYERGMQNRLTRLLNQYERLKKVRPHMPNPEAEEAKLAKIRKYQIECEDERRREGPYALTEQQAREVSEAMDRRAEHQKREREQWEREKEQEKEQERERERLASKQTQSKPTENAAGALEMQKVRENHDAPVTEQSQPSPDVTKSAGGLPCAGLKT